MTGKSDRAQEMPDDLMDMLFDDTPVEVMVVVSPEDARIERERVIFERELKTALSRPSNDHPRSPRKRR